MQIVYFDSLVKDGETIVIATVIDETGKGISRIEGKGTTKEEVKIALAKALSDFETYYTQTSETKTLATDVISEINAVITGVKI